MTLLVHNLNVFYGKQQVLHSACLTAKAGDVTAIIGPNGSGKSTLLKAICKDLPFKGDVILNDVKVDDTNPSMLAQMRGVLPQASSLAFPFTAIEVVQIGLTNGRYADQPNKAQLALQRVGLAHCAHRFYQELSGGEQQRVQLARVLAQIGPATAQDVPKWLMLDEPVASLDIAHQLQVMQLAKDFAMSGGGVLAVMHDLNLTAMFADQVIIMSEGRILKAGQPAMVMTDAFLSDAYGCDLKMSRTPEDHTPFFLPHAATRTDQPEGSTPQCNPA